MLITVTLEPETGSEVDATVLGYLLHGAFLATAAPRGRELRGPLYGGGGPG